MTSRSLRHRAPLLWLVGPLIAGLATGKAGLVIPTGPVLAAAFAAAGYALWAAWRDARGWAAALTVALTLAGIASYHLNRARLPAWDTLPPREVRLQLQIDRVFTQTDPRRASGLATVTRAESHVRELVGQHLYFSLTLKKGEAAPVRSAVVSTIGVLETIPPSPPSDSFDGYLAGAGMNFRLKRGQVLAEERPASAYYRFCAQAATRFKAILALGIAQRWPTLSGLLCAMMLGETHELSTEQHTLFMESGTMHLFAISGLNIGVIAGALQLILLLLRLPGWARFVVGVALLWLFVDITGASPSAVRAFVMAVFFQTAFVLRRPANPLAALVASALAVLVVAPLQLFSASFLMSYAIVAALLVLGLPLGEAWMERWKPWRNLPRATWAWWQRALAGAWHATATALAIGVATTLVGLLTGLQFFRLLTPGSLVANLVLIPTAMLATLFGFASLLFGLVGWTWGATMANYAAGIVLWGIEQIVRGSVRLPGAFIPAHFRADWIGPVALSVLMAALLAGYANAWKHERGGWWPPFAVVGLVLLCGVKFG